jgi:DNA-directed RNA polymerase specialized sigma24 family protein
MNSDQAGFRAMTKISSSNEPKPTGTRVEEAARKAAEAAYKRYVERSGISDDDKRKDEDDFNKIVAFLLPIGEIVANYCLPKNDPQGIPSVVNKVLTEIVMKKHGRLNRKGWDPNGKAPLATYFRSRVKSECRTITRSFKREWTLDENASREQILMTLRSEFVRPGQLRFGWVGTDEEILDRFDRELRLARARKRQPDNEIFMLPVESAVRSMKTGFSGSAGEDDDLSEDDRFGPDKDNDSNPVVVAINQETAEKLRFAIQELQPKHRELMDLYYDNIYYERYGSSSDVMTKGDMANKLGISPQVFSNRLRAAKEEFRQLSSKLIDDDAGDDTSFTGKT